MNKVTEMLIRERDACVKAFESGTYKDAWSNDKVKKVSPWQQEHKSALIKTMDRLIELAKQEE